MPTAELSLSLETAERGVEPAAPPAPLEVIAKVTSAKLAAEQPGQLPPGADRQIAKAKGSRIKLEVAPSGAGRIVGIEPAKDLDASLSLLVRAAADTLVLSFLPYPTEPVGAGAFWMVTSRETYAGLDVVVYRMVKVQEIKPDRVVLDVSTKRFVAAGQVSFPGVPPHQVQEFSGNANGRMEVIPSDTSSVHAELTDVLLANLTPQAAAASAQAQKMGLQIQVRTRLAVGR